MIYPVATIMGFDQWIIVLLIVLVLFGGTKIPELMRGVGKGVGELQKGIEEGKRAMAESVRSEDTTNSTTQSTTPKS